MGPNPNQGWVVWRAFVTLGDSKTYHPLANNISTLSSSVAPPPIQPEQEWANALTHGMAAKWSVFGGVVLVVFASMQSAAMGWACAAYMAAVFATFLSSFLSHFFLKQPWLNTFRAWDQAMIFTMIVGTYTPIALTYTSGLLQYTLIGSMWLAAAIGVISKVVYRHRLNNISALPYVALGWLPAAVLYFTTPGWVVLMMLAGGVTYSAGIFFLMFDRNHRYFHAVWHLFVITAAGIHYAAVWMIIRSQV